MDVLGAVLVVAGVAEEKKRDRGLEKVETIRDVAGTRTQPTVGSPEQGMIMGEGKRRRIGDLLSGEWPYRAGPR